MRKSNVMIAILSTAAIMVAAPAHAQPKSKEQEPPFTLDYHLPEVKITFGVSYRITACPRGYTNDLSGFAMETVTAMGPSPRSKGCAATAARIRSPITGSWCLAIGRNTSRNSRSLQRAT